MSKLTYTRGLLMNIAGEIRVGARAYLPKEKALEMLKLYTGQNFGYDIVAWKQWLKDNKSIYKKPSLTKE
jgi:hypothetical protein